MTMLLVLLFALVMGGCGSDTAKELSDFTEIQTPSSFMMEVDPSSAELGDADILPEEMVGLFKNALTDEASRTELVMRVRDASFCNTMDDWDDERLWDALVYEFNLDELEEWGNNLDEAVRNALAYDLNLDDRDDDDFYEETLEAEEIWAMLADEVDSEDHVPGQCR